MTERELRRTALIIPPRGRAVLCCWAAIPGLLAAPFVFWQSLPAGVVFCLLWAAAGYRREGLWLREGRMTLRRQQGLYLHCICVLHPDVCLTAAQSPWAASVGRTNLTLTFPGWVKLKVRSVPLRDAEKFFRFMETN